jgi:uncharacterized protein (TIGR02453 family)
MKYFNPPFSKFFKDLAKNNNCEWFNENRKVYEKEVKIPFTRLVTDLADEIRKSEPGVPGKASEMMMRINRDIRFSKDKAPYNLHMSALISEGGKKDKTIPGIFIQLSPEGLTFYSGAYFLESAQLLKVRTKIASNLKGFKSAYSSKPFVEAFAEILGEKSSRIPSELKAAAEKEPLIYNKNFYFHTSRPESILTSDSLFKEIMHLHKAGFKVNEFLKQAIR